VLLGAAEEEKNIVHPNPVVELIVVIIPTETDVQRRLLHPARMKRHKYEDWKSPKRP
jgi:hypothetical protein